MNFSYPFLLDGATGSNLIAAGMNPGERTADFILSHPDVMADLQRRYIEAGSCVIHAPTFGVTPTKFGSEYADTLRRLVSLTRETAEKYGNGKVLIASDMSPCGLFAEPMGHATFDDIYNDFAAQIKIFVEEGVDILSFMTMYSLYESRIALLACKELSDKPIFASVTVDKNGRTMTGSDIRTCVSLLGALGASAAGLNCSTGPYDTAANLRSAFSAANVPLYCKPNAGTDVENYLSPEAFAEAMKLLISEGACVVGGCCGTSPDHISALSKILPTCTVKQIDRNANNGKIAVCTEKSWREFDGNISLSPVYDVETFLEECFDFDPDEYDAAHIELTCIDDAKELLSSCYMFDIPLAVTCDDFAVAEKMAREYCGNLIFTDRCELEPEQRTYLSSAYASLFI